MNSLSVLRAVLGAPVVAEGPRPALVAVAADGVRRAAAVLAHEARHAHPLAHGPQGADPRLTASGRGLRGGGGGRCGCGVTGGQGRGLRLVGGRRHGGV